MSQYIDKMRILHMQYFLLRKYLIGGISNYYVLSINAAAKPLGAASSGTYTRNVVL
jgi:hypothetical protein